MLLEASCHCGSVEYSVESRYPQPFMRCYRSNCRNTGGSGGYGINLSANAKSLQVNVREHTRIYRAAREVDGVQTLSGNERHFCSLCGSHLWAYNSKWPDLLHPVAGCVDTPLPKPESYVHIMLGSKADWVEAFGCEGDPRFDQYPDVSLAQWHEIHNVAVD